MIPILSAVSSAIGTIAAGQAPQAALQRPSAQAERADFGEILGQFGKTIDDLKTAEATAISGIRGDVSVQRVVETMMKAEDSLQTALALRDKVVSAYQVLSQMAI